ncbi:hypothetical protein SXCC_01717 [Gluconacetobacter sp. SXCC-1]|nr:hypothetical protein SXCC_01717 [Gluconacetobacter sp. SXCC-1]
MGGPHTVKLRVATKGGNRGSGLVHDVRVHFLRRPLPRLRGGTGPGFGLAGRPRDRDRMPGCSGGDEWRLMARKPWRP